MADTGRRDELEAQALYELLAKSVSPLFYERDADGIPQGWVERIRHTLRSLGPKVQAERMVRRFLDWHRANPRELVTVEQELRVRVGQVEITGRVDRLERDDDGSAIVVDLKTGSSRPADDELDRHPQLGVYQLAVLLGAFEDLGVTRPGGAELVQVGKAGLTARARVQQQRSLSSDPEPGWASDLVQTVATGMSGSVFKATANPGCRVCPVAACCPVHERGGQVTS